jgi:hypothetical protein
VKLPNRALQAYRLAGSVVAAFARWGSRKWLDVLLGVYPLAASLRWDLEREFEQAISARDQLRRAFFFSLSASMSARYTHCAEKRTCSRTRGKVPDGLPEPNEYIPIKTITFLSMIIISALAAVPTAWVIFVAAVVNLGWTDYFALLKLGERLAVWPTMTFLAVNACSMAVMLVTYMNLKKLMIKHGLYEELEAKSNP